MSSGSAKAFQLTLGILKPHVLAAPHVFQEINLKILEAGFLVAESKTGVISESEAQDFYREHIGKFFFNRLTTFMCSGPCGFYVLAKENAIDDWRKMLGPTKVFQAQFTHPDTIRGEFGLSDTRNAAHGSDSTESAAREIQVFFPHLDTKLLTENLKKGLK